MFLSRSFTRFLVSRGLILIDFIFAVVLDRQPGKGLNPYGESLETRDEARERLAAGVTDQRATTYQDETPGK